MTITKNADGLFVKYGRDEAMKTSGGEVSVDNNLHSYAFKLPYSEVQSATKAIVGSVGQPGNFGVVLPKGLTIKEVQIFTDTAMTSSGTIGSATLQLGLDKASDRSTAYDDDGLSTTSLVGSTFDADGETNVIRVGSTGAGSAIGKTLTEDVVITALNSQHASHPLGTGTLDIKVIGYYK